MDVPLLRKETYMDILQCIFYFCGSSTTLKDDSVKFIDSERLLNSSLDKVTSLLPGEASEITKKISWEYVREKRAHVDEVFHEKGIYEKSKN